MNPRVFQISYLVLIFAACVFLAGLDYRTKLETDVAALLPDIDSQEARLARSLISDQQGRVVYLEMSDASKMPSLLSELRSSTLVDSAIEVDESLNWPAIQWMGEKRLHLLFPQWWTQKQEAYSEETVDESFSRWAALQAVEDMELFLESPMAFELARPEILDPLLLNISAIQRFTDQEKDAPDRPSDKGYVWMELSKSPLEPETQEELASMMAELEEQLSLNFDYGGLVRLAGASRERIERDVFRINFMSLFGVLLIGTVLLGNPLKLVYVLPTFFAGAVGAVTFSFLVFDQVNVIVLIVGAILIGTTIDYAIHLLYSDSFERGFPAAKLVGLACFSTVSGFLILLSSDLALIRQIGVFVGGGLLSAYLAALLFIQRVEVKPKAWVPRLNLGRLTPLLSLLLLGVALFGYTQVNWRDDIRNLEAPDDELVTRDYELRERMGMTGSEGLLFLTIGTSYLDLIEKERELLAATPSELDSPFTMTNYLPSQKEVQILISSAETLPSFFEEIRVAFTEAGYDVETFADFFDEARQFIKEFDSDEVNFEESIEGLVSRLQGPLAQVIGLNEQSYWSLSSLNVPLDVANEIASPLAASSVFSRLSFLNQTLNDHRLSLVRYGFAAIALVAVIILFSLGWLKGLCSILFPVLGGLVSISIASLISGDLNMFHLIGCFLGGAIALDYALFSVEAFSRGQEIPYSVWLSGGTTTASFLALAFSAIPVVQALGIIVACISFSTLLLLHGSRVLLIPILKSHGNE